MSDFTGITSGLDLFLSQCLSETSSTPTTNANETLTTPTTSPTTSPAAAITKLPGYPLPHDISTDGAISTYLLDDSTGVILINTFEEEDSESGHGFQMFLTRAIGDLKSCGVKRTIIDVTSNGGGSIVLGLDTYKQFFPDVALWGASNMRAHPAAEVFFQITSETINSPTTNETDKSDFDATPFSYYFQRDIKGNYFQSWEEAYGPIERYNDSFTNLTRWDIVNENAFGWDFNVTNGDGIRNASYATPWDAENIVIVRSYDIPDLLAIVNPNLILLV